MAKEIQIIHMQGTQQEREAILGATDKVIIWHEPDGSIYQSHATGWSQTHAVGGAGLVTTSGYVPDPDVTGKNRHVVDALNYTGHDTYTGDDATAVAAAEVWRREWTEAEKVTAIFVDGWGGAGFKAILVTLNKTAGAEEEAALRKHKGTSDDNDHEVIIVGRGGRFIPVIGGYITSISGTVIDTEAAEDNHIEISAY
jgi:hypothetical protein